MIEFVKLLSSEIDHLLRKNNMQRIEKKDIEDVITFSNKQFNRNMKIVQPKIYLTDKVLNHFILKDNEKIVSTLCVYEGNFCNLNCLSIGTVCVDEEYRNQGYMGKMFDYLEKNIFDKYDLIYLSGARFRYENFGFYKTGLKCRFFIKKNYHNEKEYSFIEASKINENELYSMYINTFHKINRQPSNFWELLTTDANQVFIFSNNDIKGYIVYHSRTNSIVESTIINESIVIDFINHLGLTDISIIEDYDLSKNLLKICDKYQIETLGNLRVINYFKVIKNLLEDKHDLINGSLSIKMENEIIKINVNDGKVDVSKCGDGSFDYELTIHELMEMLFENYCFKHQEKLCKIELITSWFPLSLPHTLMSIDGI